MTCIFTARKQSFGQGNVSTGVCLSSGGILYALYDVTSCLSRGYLSGQGVSVWEEGDLCPRGEGGVSVQEGGLCPRGGSLFRRVSVRETPAPYSKEWAVSILLECILV